MGGYSFFSSVYDTLTENVNYAARADYIADLLADNGIKGGILLDLACGTGTLSVEMSKKGFEVIGVDASADMLSVAMNNAYEAERNILFLCQPMQQLDLYGTINAAICTLDSINHLTDEADVQATFDKVSLFTEPGGIFIFDVNTPYKFENIYSDNSYVLEDENEDGGAIYCGWQNFYDRESRVCDFYLSVFEEGENGQYYRDDEHQRERCYTREEIENALASTGFELLGVYNGLDFEALTPTDERWYFVARAKK